MIIETLDEMLTTITQQTVETMEYFITGEWISDAFGVPSPSAEPTIDFVVLYVVGILLSIVIVYALDLYYSTHPADVDDGEGDLR